MQENNMILHNELGTEMISKYLMLRAAGKIGCIWSTGEIVEFSEATNILERRVLPIGEYRKLISYWFPTNQKEVEYEQLKKIGPKREERNRRTRAASKNPVFLPKTG